MVKETKQLFICQRCGGQVLHFSDGINCLQCGAAHTKEGKLATYSAQELGFICPRRDGRVPLRLTLPQLGVVRRQLASAKL